MARCLSSDTDSCGGSDPTAETKHVSDLTEERKTRFKTILLIKTFTRNFQIFLTIVFVPQWLIFLTLLHV